MYIVDAVIRLFVGFKASCSKVQGNIEEINHFFVCINRDVQAVVFKYLAHFFLHIFDCSWSLVGDS